MKSGLVKMVLLAACTTAVAGFGTRAMGQYAPAPVYCSPDAISQAEANLRNAVAASDQAQSDVAAARQRAGDIAAALSQAQAAQTAAQRDADAAASIAIGHVRYTYAYRDAVAQADAADQALSDARRYRYVDPRLLSDLTARSNDAHARVNAMLDQAIDADPQARAARDNARQASDRVNQIAGDLRNAQDDVATRQACADQAASVAASAQQQRDALVNPYPTNPPVVYAPAPSPSINLNFDFGWFGHRHDHHDDHWRR